VRYAAMGILAAMAALPAGDPAGFNLFRSAELKGAERRLAPKIDAKKVAAETLAEWGNHRIMVAHREGNGEAEWHEKQADIFVVQTGEATLVYGGKVVDGKSTGPGEIRGPSISGGLEKKLSPGDIVHIPAKTPHQVMVTKQFTYATIKVDQ
jgi:mannose-6-phosphate isomerase-like protein (cupin superfamily)